MSIKTTGLLLVLCAASLVCGGTGTPETERPNIVFILADDLGWSDLSYQGSTFYRTPHIDALIRSGMWFGSAYANAPNCAPTRASLMSGQYAPRHGIYTVGDPWRGPKASRRLVPAENTTTLSPGVVTLAEALKAAGYVTAHLGKWHLGKPGEAGPREQGFDVNLGGTHAGHPPTYFSPYRIATLDDGPEGEYLTDRLTDEALRFIAAHRDTTFFLYLPHFAVHTPIQGKPALAEQYETAPAWHGQHNADYAAMIESLDASVGRLLAGLDSLGLSEKTIVVFTSDNGGLGGYASAGLPHSRDVTDNYPLKGGKGQLYEGGIRVPTAVRWPGVTAAGTTSDVPILSHDFYPTLLEMAGAAPPEDQTLDGLSLAPLLRGEAAPDRDALFWFFPAYLQAYGPTGLRTAPAAAVRQGDAKLIWFFEDDRVEYYDLREDLGEEHDLAASDPGRAAALRARLGKWLAETEAPLPIPNPAYDPAAVQP